MNPPADVNNVEIDLENVPLDGFRRGAYRIQHQADDQTNTHEADTNMQTRFKNNPQASFPAV